MSLRSSSAQPPAGRSSRTRVRARARLFVFVVLLLSTGCAEMPRDPANSLDRILERGTIRVGASHSPPWVIVEGDSVRGAEAVLIQRFAEELGVRVEWRPAGLDPLMEALERYDLDLVAGGLTGSNPWGMHVGFTLKYYTTRLVAAAHTSDTGGLDGASVAIRPLSGLEDELADRGATARVVERPAPLEGIAAGAGWEVLTPDRARVLADLGERDHVMAVPSGENALLMRLEQFLLQRVDSATLVDILRQQNR